MRSSSARVLRATRSCGFRPRAAREAFAALGPRRGAEGPEVAAARGLRRLAEHTRRLPRDHLLVRPWLKVCLTSPRRSTLEASGCGRLVVSRSLNSCFLQIVSSEASDRRRPRIGVRSPGRPPVNCSRRWSGTFTARLPSGRPAPYGRHCRGPVPRSAARSVANCPLRPALALLTHAPAWSSFCARSRSHRRREETAPGTDRAPLRSRGS